MPVGWGEVRRVQGIISEARRRSVREISDMTVICVNVVYCILADTLKMSKVGAAASHTRSEDHER